MPRSILKNLLQLSKSVFCVKLQQFSVNFENVSPQALSSNFSGLFKLRVGDYRVIYSFATKEQ